MSCWGSCLHCRGRGGGGGRGGGLDVAVVVVMTIIDCSGIEVDVGSVVVIVLVNNRGVGSQWSRASFPYFTFMFIAVWPSVVVSNTEVCCPLFIVSGADCVHTRHLRYLVHVQ